MHRLLDNIPTTGKHFRPTGKKYIEPTGKNIQLNFTCSSPTGTISHRLQASVSEGREGAYIKRPEIPSATSTPHCHAHVHAHSPTQCRATTQCCAATQRSAQTGAQADGQAGDCHALDRSRAHFPARSLCTTGACRALCQTGACRALCQTGARRAHVPTAAHRSLHLCPALCQAVRETELSSSIHAHLQGEAQASARTHPHGQGHVPAHARLVPGEQHPIRAVGHTQSRGRSHVRPPGQHVVGGAHVQTR